jgi:hypothetical protein
MEYCKFVLDQNNLYQYGGSSSTSITILTGFLMEDYRYGYKFFKKWAIELNDPNPEYGTTCGGNCTYLEYENGNIFIDHHFLQDEKNPQLAKISREQFIKILDEWEQKVVNADPKPKEIIIKQDGDQFFIETKV